MDNADLESVGGLTSTVARVLREAHIREPNTEARDIVAAVYDQPRFWPLANAHAPVEGEIGGRVLDAARRRAAGAPLAYAVGRAAFRHLTLDVDERVLIPRPETEHLVELVLQELLTQPPRRGVAIDVG